MLLPAAAQALLGSPAARDYRCEASLTRTQTYTQDVCAATCLSECMACPQSMGAAPEQSLSRICLHKGEAQGGPVSLPPKDLP